MSEREYVVYKHTNLVNGKIYKNPQYVGDTEKATQLINI